MTTNRFSRLIFAYLFLLFSSPLFRFQWFGSSFPLNYTVPLMSLSIFFFPFEWNARFYVLVNKCADLNSCERKTEQTQALFFTDELWTWSRERGNSIWFNVLRWKADPFLPCKRIGACDERCDFARRERERERGDLVFEFSIQPIRKEYLFLPLQTVVQYAQSNHRWQTLKTAVYSHRKNFLFDLSAGMKCHLY